MKINPQIRDALLSLSEKEYTLLEKSLLSEGCRDSLIVWGNTIIDGHNRFEICQKHSIPYNKIEKEFGDIKEAICWLRNLHLGRRNLTKEHKKYLRGQTYDENKKDKNQNLKQNLPSAHFGHSVSPKTCEKIAAQEGVGQATIRRDHQYFKAINTISKNCGKEVKSQILDRKIKATDKEVIRLAEKEPEQQMQITEKLMSREAQTIQDAQRQAKKERVKSTPPIQGKYRIIYAVPRSYPY